MKTLLSSVKALGNTQPMDIAAPIVLIILGCLTGPVGAFLLVKARRLDEGVARDYMEVIGAALCIICVACFGFGFFGR